MKNSNLHWIGLLLLATLWSCEPSQSSSNGGQAPKDTVATPVPSNGARAWAADKNLLDPNLLDGLPEGLDAYQMPFSAAFLQARGIQSIVRNRYSEVDNDGLENASTEDGLILTARTSYSFSSVGLPTKILDEKFLGDASTAATSFMAIWTYDPQGKPLQIEFSENMGLDPHIYHLRYDYGPDGRLHSSTSTVMASTYYMYDDAQQRSYLLRTSGKNIGAQVYVWGPKGSFPDETCLEIYQAIANRESGYVDSGLMGAKLDKVIFQEKDGRKIVREVHVLRKDRIDAVIPRVYSDDGNLATRQFHWGDEAAKLQSITHFRCDAQGNLLQILQTRKVFNGDLTTESDLFSYAPDGLLLQAQHFKRVNQDPDVLEYVDFYHSNATAKAQPAPSSAQPGASSAGH